jgi:hypothetical protein
MSANSSMKMTMNGSVQLARRFVQVGIRLEQRVHHRLAAVARPSPSC